MKILLFLFLSVPCFSQSITSFTGQKDTIGNFYLVRVTQTVTKEGNEVLQLVSKHASKPEMIKAAWDLIAELKKQQGEVENIIKSLTEN